MSWIGDVNLVRRRKSGGAYVRGQWVTGEQHSDVAFKGSWQPASGKTLELLPEGKRSREVFKCLVEPPSLDFTSADAHGEVEADSVVWQDKEYEVTTASLWDNGLIPHWELLCTRPKEGEK